MQTRNPAGDANDDDFFLFSELDMFPSEVDILVTSVYESTIDGIELLDKQKRPEIKARNIDSDLAAQQEGWWDSQVQAMKYHAGNMGLVSLVSLFENWRERRVEKGKRKSRFEFVNSLPGTPLTKSELEDMVTARNSIIHHRDKAEFEYGRKLYTVNDRFLDFDNPLQERRVAVDGSLLTELASKLKSFVNLWNQQKRHSRNL
jgi:hypothetical protein